jgi:hypothetical protein
MPCARIWTENADQTIRAMREAGATWSAIGVCLGLSRNTVIERGRRLCAAAPVRLPALTISRHTLDDPNRDPLPAGHQLTWGLLSDEKFPAPIPTRIEERQELVRAPEQAA